MQALPGIFKPYSKGVGMMLTKPPADQKGKDMLMIFHHFLSFGRLMNAVTFITAAFVCPCKPLIWFFLLFGLAYTCLALYEVKAGPRADRFSVTPKFLNAMIALFGVLVATGAAGDSPDRFVAQAPSASAGRYYERYDTPALELDGAIVADEESFFGYNAMR